MFKTTISPEVTEGRGEPAYNRAGAMDTDIANSGVTSRGGRAQPQQQNLQKAATQQQLGQLKFTTADGRGRQTSAAAGGGAISAAEIDNDFNILASILSEEINHFGLGVPPASNVFNPMTFPGVVGAGGLLGLNFANRLNSTVGWPMMTTQVPQQQQQQPSHQPLQQLPPQRSPPAMVSQASHQAQPTPSPPQQQPLIGSPPASFFGAGGGGIPPQPQQLTFVSQPQRYISPVTMGLGGIGMPMPCLAPAVGIHSAEKLSVAPAMPGAPGVSMLAARAENMLAASRQGTNKRRRDETRDQKKFTEQIVRRRERNRILAKQTRLRKKFFYQSLQKRLATLRAENKTLKSVLTERMGERAKQVVYDCTSELSRQIVAGTVETGEDVDAEIEGMGGEGGKGNADTGTKILARPDFNLVKSLQLAQQIFVVTDPSLPDNPIVYASAGFLKLTGYKSEQVIGRNCRFLQGPDTDKQSVAIIREAIEKGEDAHVNLINYKADGTPFWNSFFVASLRDENNRIMNYVGAQCPIPGPLPPFRRKTDESPDLVDDKWGGGGGKDGGSSGGGSSGGGSGGGGGGFCLRQSGSEVDSQHEDTGNDLRGAEGGEASDVHTPPEEKDNIVGEVLGKVRDGYNHVDTSSLDRGDRSNGESVGEMIGGKSREVRLLGTPGVAVMTAAEREIKTAEAAGNSLQFLTPDKRKSFGSSAFSAQSGVQVETVAQ